MGGDTPQTDVFSDIFGSGVSDIKNMIHMMKMEDYLASSDRRPEEMYITSMIDASKYCVIPVELEQSKAVKPSVRKLRGILVPPYSASIFSPNSQWNKYSDITSKDLEIYNEVYLSAKKGVLGILNCEKEEDLNLRKATVKTVGFSAENQSEKTATIIAYPNIDIAYELVNNGYAIVIPQEFEKSEEDEKKKYLTAQKEASKNMRGLWGTYNDIMISLSKGSLWKNKDSELS